jgi:hypothetical protein
MFFRYEFSISVGITLTAYGIAGRIHFLAERIGDGIGADGAEDRQACLSFWIWTAVMGLTPLRCGLRSQSN